MMPNLKTNFFNRIFLQANQFLSSLSINPVSLTLSHRNLMKAASVCFDALRFVDMTLAVVQCSAR